VNSEASPAGAAPPAGSSRPATFEAAYQELRTVIERLEGGGLGLDDAVRLFERGCELVRVCEGIVKGAQLRVTRLTPESAAPITDAPDEE
jgi:exodeoxyribonuclease VII small subunit